MARLISRRQLIGYGLAAAAAGTASAIVGGCAPNTATRRSAELPEPGVLQSRDGVLSVRLTAR
ncbi:MAG: hypothetical protein ACREQM_14795, partial [Candidatus Dormibacteraceae bacterium]